MRLACLYFLINRKTPAETAKPDIAEIKQIEQIVFRQPQGHGDSLENDQYDQRMQIFFDLFHNRLSHNCLALQICVPRVLWSSFRPLHTAHAQYSTGFGFRVIIP